MFLNPPFAQFNFSISRSIKLFKGNTDDLDFENYLDDYFIAKLNNTLNTVNVYVVGEYNEDYPFFLPNMNDYHIYTLDPNYNINKLAPIANSLESLYTILKQGLINPKAILHFEKPSSELRLDKIEGIINKSLPKDFVVFIRFALE
jgi:hypothetical protein